MSRTKLKNYNTTDVFVAACAAQRIHGTYRKEVVVNEDGSLSIPNKVLVRNILDSNMSQVIDSDREEAENVIQYCRSMTFKLLSGAELNEFEQNMLKLVENEYSSTNFEINTIASLPASYHRGMARKSVEYRLRMAEGHVGNIGDRITITIEVVRSAYSKNYGTYYITGLTEDNKAVFFSSHRAFAAGTNHTIIGRVKAHRENNTQLNYVSLRS